MIEQFADPVPNYTPQRKPLQIPVDASVVQNLVNFNFGLPDILHQQLFELINSPRHRDAVILWEDGLARAGKTKAGVIESMRSGWKRGVVVNKGKIQKWQDVHPDFDVLKFYGSVPNTRISMPVLAMYYLASERKKVGEAADFSKDH